MEQNWSSDHAVSRDIQNGKMEREYRSQWEIEPTESGRNEVAGFEWYKSKSKKIWST
jgi:hypothetical protein